MFERLNAHRQAGDPLIEERAQVSLVDRIRVGLGRDLSSRFQGERAPEFVKELYESERREHGGRSTAEEERDELHSAPLRRPKFRLFDQGVDVATGQVIKAGVRVEVAVAAASQAERDVHVQPGVHACLPAGSRSTRSAAMNASWGTSTRPTRRIRFFPSFCLSKSFRLRVMSPP